MVLGEDVSQMMVVVVGVVGASQRQDLVAGGLGKTTGRGPSPVAAGQAGRAIAPVGGQEAANLPQGKLKLGSRLMGIPTTGQDFRDHVQALLLSNGQGHLGVHEVTFSLNHWR